MPAINFLVTAERTDDFATAFSRPQTEITEVRSAGTDRFPITSSGYSALTIGRSVNRRT